MEKSQYDLCVEVLRRLDKAGVLKNIVLVGSWCTLFYKSYFGKTGYTAVLKTRDVCAAAVGNPHQGQRGGITKGPWICCRICRPAGLYPAGASGIDCRISEIERGRPSDKPYPLPKLGINAQPLRFLEMHANNTITVKIEDLSVKLPHPANFTLHKLLVLQRRPSPQKAEKDKETAIRILEALADKGERDTVRKIFQALPARWQRKIQNALQDVDSSKVTRLFS